MDFKSCFELVQHRMPEALIDLESKSKILSYVPEFQLFSLASFECALGCQSPLVDVAIAFESDQITTSVLNQIQHQNLKRILSDPKHPLYLSIRGLWLNYDTTMVNLPHPWTYIVLQKFRLGNAYYAALIDQLLGHYTDEYAENMTLIRSCIHHLPEDGYVMGLALPEDRNSNATRLVLYGMDLNRISTYLNEISWTGDRQKAIDRLHAFNSCSEEVGLIIDIRNGTFVHKLGFELLCERSVNRGLVLKMLEVLSSWQCVDQTKLKALIHWISKEEIHFNSPESPSLDVWLNHIKVTLQEDDTMTAKSYFGVQPMRHSFHE